MSQTEPAPRRRLQPLQLTRWALLPPLSLGPVHGAGPQAAGAHGLPSHSDGHRQTALPTHTPSEARLTPLKLGKPTPHPSALFSHLGAAVGKESLHSLPAKKTSQPLTPPGCIPGGSNKARILSCSQRGRRNGSLLPGMQGRGDGEALEERPHTRD